MWCGARGVSDLGQWILPLFRPHLEVCEQTQPVEVVLEVGLVPRDQRALRPQQLPRCHGLQPQVAQDPAGREVGGGGRGVRSGDGVHGVNLLGKTREGTAPTYTPYLADSVAMPLAHAPPTASISLAACLPLAQPPSARPRT